VGASVALIRPASRVRPAADSDPAEGPEDRWMLTSDGQLLALTVGPARSGVGDGDALVLLHATLADRTSLIPLARALADEGRCLLLDRRGSGGSRMPAPAPVPVARHAEDVLETLDGCGIRRALIVGHSFGGVVGLELAAAHPDRVLGVVAFEPPYLPLADAEHLETVGSVAATVLEAHATGGATAATRGFMELVAPGDWARLRPSTRHVLEAQGDAVLADAAMPGLDVADLDAIRVPVALITGDRSEPFYLPIARALVRHLRHARLVHIEGLRHTGPIADPGRIAPVVQELWAAARRSARAVPAGARQP
jgi:pimeloyl-ACP methyl ester carboxylesterase